MKRVLLFIVIALLGLAPLCAEEAPETLASLQNELEVARQELEVARQKAEALETKCAELDAKIQLLSQGDAAGEKTQPVQEKEVGKEAQEAVGTNAPQPGNQAEQSPETPHAAVRKGELEVALLPDAEMVLYHDKAFLQAKFNISLRARILFEMQKTLSQKEYERLQNYAVAFSHFNFLYSVSASKAIDTTGSHFNYGKADWVMGWEAEAPVDWWLAEAQTTALELVRHLHRGLMSNALPLPVKMQMEAWRVKDSATPVVAPGWTLYPVRCTAPDETMEYELLWAVADSRKLFFLGPRETILRQLKADSTPSADNLRIYEKMREKNDRRPWLDARCRLQEEAIKKIDNLLLDFRRPGDAALREYLLRTTSSRLLLAAGTTEMQARMEITFEDALVAKDFQNVLEQMTIPEILKMFGKENLAELPCFKKATVSSPGGSVVVLEMHVPLTDLIQLSVQMNPARKSGK